MFVPTEKIDNSNFIEKDKGNYTEFNYELAKRLGGIDNDAVPNYNREFLTDEKVEAISSFLRSTLYKPALEKIKTKKK